MLTITIGIGAILYWRILIGNLNILLALFWLIWPDLASFIPIGLAGGSKGWPRWGSALYNFSHTFLFWMSVFVVWSLVSGGIEWPLLGWAAHIALDRAAGFYLRAPADTPDSDSEV